MGISFKFNRILTYLIDGLVMFILMALICVAPSIIFFRDLLNGSFNTNELLWLSFSVFGSFCVWILYLFVTSLIFKGATLGMKISHLSFKKINDSDLTFRNLLYRETVVVLCIVLSLGFSVIFDLMSVICSKNGRTFHDVYSYMKVVSSRELY